MAGISIVDYGLGNLRSVVKGFEKVGGEVDVVEEGSRLLDYDGVVIPGVGAFEDGVKRIREIDSFLYRLIEDGVPVLGICLGMQMLLTRSFESDKWVDGLDVIGGDVVRFKGVRKIPHMGWSKVTPSKKHRLFNGIEDGSYFYFAHSYHVRPKFEKDVVAESIYGESFPAAISRKNVVGVQFHPEKSGKTGLRVLKNFLEITKNK
ncbi:imidazole glycerol phosphate synthase subunit HisH [Methanonatronarchaeum sp. AMET-Sl]|uniref:imidazole glycerol phosphate synthase subunit HisH n=1 Tax=Methanonatronarchaeum sp. AMET-Sl TaxID=3037654 RepID=UPI00244E2AB4|nr:imidazole glycerol phosphate synthase subunit HisH [Methanonatronarchaeum sp. AMET-Sl]WGI16731.1 imidazole glycerol phosphate synthase subunit HisH [Methanonatronarchaeum sp. AMET-Sl]